MSHFNLSFLNLHDLLTPNSISSLSSGGFKSLIESLIPYAIALLIFIVLAEVFIAFMERLADRFLPRIPIPFLSSIILTLIMPLIYLGQLIILAIFLSVFIPFLISLVH